MDAIRLSGLRVRGRHGVYDFERADGQDFVLDVVLELPLDKAAASDDVSDTVHYGELAETWVWMCPAGVYEIPEDAPEDGMVDVIVNYTNCVQCGAITAKGGRLTPPEGGDGPLYQVT